MTGKTGWKMRAGGGVLNRGPAAQESGFERTCGEFQFQRGFFAGQGFQQGGIAVLDDFKCERSH